MFSGQDITVVIPAHNCEKFVVDAVKSIEAQAERPHEIIIVENASWDKTFDVVHAYKAECSIPIRLIRTECPGVSNARNLGFSLVNTPLIAMLDADDFYSVSFLSNALKAFNCVEGLKLFFGNRRTILPDGGTNARFLEDTPLLDLRFSKVVDDIRRVESGLFSALLAGCFVPPSGAVVERKAAYKAGLFQVGLVSSEDRKFFCRLALEGSAAYSLEESHSYRVHDASITSRSSWIQKKRNGIIALNSLLLELSCEAGELGKVKRALSREVVILLYAGAEEGWSGLMRQTLWLRSKGVTFDRSIYLWLKSAKNSLVR